MTPDFDDLGMLDAEAGAATQKASTGVDILVLATQNPVAILTDPERFDAFYNRVKAEVEAHVPDLSTAKGRGAIASLAYKVVKTKTALDEAGKNLTNERRKEIAAVDAARRNIRDSLDVLRDKVRQPLDEWEAAWAKAKEEADRKAEAARKAEEERIAAAAADAAKAKAEADAQAERDDREKAHAAELAAAQAKIDAAERAAKAEAEARAKAARDAQAAADAAAKAQADREADIAHRSKIMREAKEAVMALGVDEPVAKEIVLAIAARSIPHVTISF